MQVETAPPVPVGLQQVMKVEKSIVGAVQDAPAEQAEIRRVLLAGARMVLVPDVLPATPERHGLHARNAGARLWTWIAHPGLPSASRHQPENGSRPWR